MPPAISDDETSETGNAGVRSDILPSRGRERKPAIVDKDTEDDSADGPEANATAGKDGNDEGEEDDDEELDEDEFVVEKIFSHYVDENGEIRFEVKWEGWEKKSDRTWEPEENLRDTASEVLQEYFKKVGGREAIFEQTKNALKSRKRGRLSSAAGTPSEKRSRRNGHPEDSTPPASAKAAEWKPPSGVWEDDIDTVDMCQDEENGTFIVYLTWKNGKKTQHPKEVVYRRCPQKMLRFYERHIRISRDAGSPSANSGKKPQDGPETS